MSYNCYYIKYKSKVKIKINYKVKIKINYTIYYNYSNTTAVVTMGKGDCHHQTPAELNT